MRILVTGSRNWTDRSPVYQALEHYRHLWPVVVVHGGAEGADTIADEIAHEFDIPTEAYYPRDYRGSPKPAPLARNDAMLDSLDPDRDTVIAFMLGSPERGGTLYTVNGAKARGLKVIIFNWPGDPVYRG